MEAMAVNWGVLDEMVLDFCTTEGLLEREQEGGDSSTAIREAIKQIRALIERGRISEAVALITEHADVLLQDQRILFWLYKQKFIEMLRDGGSAARSEAIECSRAKLGPCALNAYPEAYEEFKRILLVLIFDRDHHNSPVAEEWSEARRTELAATVASTLRARLQVHDPIFALALRYLISIYNAYRSRGSGAPAPPLGELGKELVLAERDPPPALLDSRAEPPSLSEVDVQALAQAAELPRQAAVESLKFTSGDLSTAIKNELSRVRINTAAVDKLVWEYCAYRGLIQISRPGCSDMDLDVPENAAGASTQGKSETRYRWRGRPPLLNPAAEKLEISDDAFAKYRQAIQMRHLVVQRRIPEAIQQVEQMDPGLFAQNPHLLFQLKQIEFFSFVEAGNHGGALEVARVDLGPLAAKHPEFLQPLKETVMSLACGGGEGGADKVSSSALAASVQVALSASLGITEPQLMKIVSACLFAHTEWFKVQMCSDPFADLLKINALKERETGTTSKSTMQPADANPPPGEVPPFEETTILTVMEWMALPRGDAIQLLADYDGNVEEALSQMVD